MNEGIVNLIAFSVIAAAIVIVAVIFIAKKRKAAKLLEAYETEIRRVALKLETAVDSLGQTYISHSMELALVELLRPEYEFLKGLSIPKKHPLFNVVSQAVGRYENLHAEVKKKNSEFVAAEKQRCDDLLSDIDGKSLDDQQRTVVVTDEDHNLVLAGAGSGKTLTIAGKVKYLVDQKKIDPKEILLIAFTHKSAEELTCRISDKLGIKVEATTFHKLGLDIIKNATGVRPDVYEKLDGFVTDYFENNMVDNAETVKALIEFFAYYLQIPADLEQYSSLGEAFEYERGMDFETVRSKYERAQFIKHETDLKKADRNTLQGETVKSLEEVSIANFLFLNGIRYEYESLYPFESDDPLRKAYRPDFYLPDYDIYIEHFGVDRQGRLPWLPPVEAEKYLDSMRWKREFHRANGTKLLETYSYYTSEGVLLEKLSFMLQNSGVKFRAPDYRQIFETIYSKASDRYFSEFKSLCSSFITLFKSNGYKTGDLEALKQKGLNTRSAFLINRTALFISIIGPIIDEYTNYLDGNGLVDFSDMIIRATELVNDGYKTVRYKYVIIDEYQDISVARYKLVKAILDQTGAHLLCVGDDWQSIYRFAGSDISLFTDFDKYFGYTSTLKIEQTYRNSQELIDEAGRFIMRNPAQLKKSLRSGKSIEYPISFWFYKDNPFPVIKRMMDKLISGFGAEASIMLLGRTNNDIELVRRSGLFEASSTKTGTDFKYIYSPQTPVTFLTVHKSKGLEADNVILLNFENSTLGFPNKIADDPVLALVLSSSDPFSYAEERRLLYVAITRTRNRVMVLTNTNRPSVFITDFKPTSNVAFVGRDDFTERTVNCPRCKKGRLTLRKNEETGKLFVGCSNYPRCNYTVKETSVMSTNMRCPSCGGFLVQRKGKYGNFTGCTNYPKCNYTLQPNKSGGKRRIGF